MNIPQEKAKEVAENYATAWCSHDPHAVFLWTLEGTHAVTGNHVEVGGWEYWRYTETGLIEESMGHFDVDEYQRQIDGA